MSECKTECKRVRRRSEYWNTKTKKEAYVTIAIMAMRGNVNSVALNVMRTTESVRIRTVIRGIFKTCDI